MSRVTLMRRPGTAGRVVGGSGCWMATAGSNEEGLAGPVWLKGIRRVCF